MTYVDYLRSAFYVLNARFESFEITNPLFERKMVYLVSWLESSTSSTERIVAFGSLK